MIGLAPLIRVAAPKDAPSILACVNAAYQPYIARIGKPPGPMLEDYAQVIYRHSVYVVDDTTECGIDGSVLGLLVLMEKPDGLLLDNIAVHPFAQGRGVGRALMNYAEVVARSRGYDAITLYTHELMIENIALYRRLGYVQFDSRVESGYRRVYMWKELRHE